MLNDRNDSFQSASPQLGRQRKYAYVTLVHGLDGSSFAYRGFLYNSIVAATALRGAGSKADFIVLYGFTFGFDPNISAIHSDIALLESFGIITIQLPRLMHDASTKSKDRVNFLEMALLKITPWSLTHYERVQYIDGDVFPYRNMDCFFQLTVNTFNTGNYSPLNSGWFVAIPNVEDFQQLRAMAIARMTTKWNETMGWGRMMPQNVYFRGARSKGMQLD
jgi:hypothetical protein